VVENGYAKWKRHGWWWDRKVLECRWEKYRENLDGRLCCKSKVVDEKGFVG